MDDTNTNKASFNVQPGKHLWQYQEEVMRCATRLNGFRRKTAEAVGAAAGAMVRHDISFSARLLYSILAARGEYVVCIDPRAISSVVGISADTIAGCLHELKKAGMVSDLYGNLVFFD